MENHSLAEGAARFRRRLNKALSRSEASTVGAGKKLLQEGLDPVTKAIEDMIGVVDGEFCSVEGCGKPISQSGMCNAHRLKAKRAGTLKPRPKGTVGRAKHSAAKWCQMVGADVAAFMTLRVCLDGVAKSVEVRRAAVEISDLILDELRFRKFKEVSEDLFKYASAKHNTGNYAWKSRSFHRSIKHSKVEIPEIEMAPKERMLVGVKLIDLLIEATGLFSIESRIIPRDGKPKTEVRLIANEKTLEWLDARNSSLELMWPVNLPMVVPPLPWGPGVKGGYMFGLRGKHSMVRGVSKPHAKALHATEMPTVYAALNRIQETPWRINHSVLSLIDGIIERGGGIAGIPHYEDKPLPPKPLDIETNEEAKEKWKREAGKTKDENHQRKMDLLAFLQTYGVAKKFSTEEAFWYPFNLDFRSRCYPISSYLTPQGDDVQKGLLTFADGKPLGENGIAYLALHLASSMGTTPTGVKLSKATLQERIDWVLDNEVLIRQVATDPFANLWWADVERIDGCFQFYAACVEWVGYLNAHAEGKGEEYVCSLPVAQDGTCNGLQHFAAMLLDPIGGAAVNVTPSERPQDIYQRIADVVNDKLEALAPTEHLARVWLKSGLVTRKLTKRPTMTFGYGSKKYGFREQLLDYLKGGAGGKKEAWKTIIKPQFSVMELDEESGEMKPRCKSKMACGLMAQLIWDALQEVVVAASEGMAWMQEVARLVAKNGNCVAWKVPGTGFLVRQEYFVLDSIQNNQVETILAGKVYRPSVYAETTNPDVNRQSNAIAPNFVHSMDAAALQLTVERASAAGVEHFGMVHDSYATLAADAPVLAHCTRQAFFSLYSNHEVIESLSDQLRSSVHPDDEYPSVPEKGDLDLSHVLMSDYFFS